MCYIRSWTLPLSNIYIIAQYLCVFWRLFALPICSLKVWLVAVMPGLSATALKVAQSQQIVGVLSSARSLKEFSSALDRFEGTCRRSI